MEREFLTIGYQGAGLDAFIAALREAGVATLIDVREAPWSRRPEFTRRALESTLGEHGIGYVHLKGLGNPKPGRDAARAGDLDAYHAIFGAQLETEAARRDLETAATLARNKRVCLMCTERDPLRCHRLIVADRLAATGLSVRHLTVEAADADEERQLRLL